MCIWTSILSVDVTHFSSLNTDFTSDHINRNLRTPLPTSLSILTYPNDLCLLLRPALHGLVYHFPLYIRFIHLTMNSQHAVSTDDEQFKRITFADVFFFCCLNVYNNFSMQFFVSRQSSEKEIIMLRGC